MWTGLAHSVWGHMRCYPHQNLSLSSQTPAHSFIFSNPKLAFLLFLNPRFCLLVEKRWVEMWGSTGGPGCLAMSGLCGNVPTHTISNIDDITTLQTLPELHRYGARDICYPWLYPGMPVPCFGYGHPLIGFWQTWTTLEVEKAEQRKLERSGLFLPSIPSLLWKLGRAGGQWHRTKGQKLSW